MHVAFFNRSFYPDQTATGQLLTDLCEDLVREHGCRVSVVAGVPLLPAGKMAAAGRAGMLRLLPEAAGRSRPPIQFGAISVCGRFPV